ncbi:unnamed protein product [Urochloa decumbens]|uniref:No apical meristem-associated C-terminal domain-containing protein n=1 Tax=Urochloa decumbens TaxID=240449 RepID=A0ABC9BLI0_9POAL
MSRQARKESAARNLMMTDAARVHKADAAANRRAALPPNRRAAPPPMQSVPGRGRAPPIPEQRSSGCDTVTPPRSFNDGSYFNGGAGDFFGSPGQSSQPWTHPSSDPATWKNEQYWTDVEVTYSETTPSHRTRNAKQIKDRFHKVNRWTDLFHSAWLKARMIYTSGYTDQMWIEKAHVFYIEDNKKIKLGPFVLMEVWNTVKTEAKWITYNSGLKAARKRATTKGSGNENEGEDRADTDFDDLDEQPRPMGQKQAKKLKFAKSKEVEHIDLEELEKFDKIQDKQNASRLKVLEVQQKLSSEKIEQSKLAHFAAKEQKEATQMQMEAKRYELETRMFELKKRKIMPIQLSV